MYILPKYQYDIRHSSRVAKFYHFYRAAWNADAV